MSEPEGDVRRLAERAKEASRRLVALPRSVKDKVLLDVARELDEQAKNPTSAVLAANAEDVAAAAQSGLEPAMVDRLRLDEKRMRGMSSALREIASYEDPVGAIVGMAKRP